MPEAPPSTTIDAASSLVGVAAMDLSVLVTTADGSSVVNETNLESVDIVPLEGRASDTGAVKAVARRGDDGVLIAAEGGLYYSDGARLVQSPATDAVVGLDVRSLATAGSGAGEVIWIGAGDGLYQLSGGALQRWTVDGEDGPVTALAAVGGLLLVAFGELLYELDTGASEDEEIDHDFGNVTQIAVLGSTAYLASDNGVVVRSGDGRYTQHTLSGDEDSGVKTYAVDVDEYAGAYAATAIGVVKVTAGKTEGVAPLPHKTRSLAVDYFGDVWVGGDSSVTGLFVGVPVSFADEVAPVLEAACAGCHAAGSAEIPVIDFSSYDTAATYAPRIVDRISQGADPMPPLVANPLSQEDVDVLLRWFTTGSAP